MDNLILILGMAIATYIPRLIPLTLLSDKKINKRLKQFLLYVPYTSLSILIIRGIMTAEGDMQVATISGIGIAAIIAYIKGNLILAILSAIVVAFFINNILL